MKGNRVVVGVFSYLDDVIKAVEAAKKENREYNVYSPVPNHELEHATFPEKSPVRIITLIGAILGCAGGFWLAIWCSLDWPMRVSAKTVVSVPAFVVIGYECTILLGAIGTLMAVFHFCKIPDILRKVGYDPRFSGDKFGVVIGCDLKEVEAISGRLQGAGAEEVQVRDAL